MKEVFSSWNAVPIEEDGMNRGQGGDSTYFEKPHPEINLRCERDLT